MQGGARWLVAATGIAAALTFAVPARAETAPQIAAVTVTGDAVVGATLTADVVVTGDPSPTLAYSWRRCSATKPSQCSAIAGATASTYVVSDADVGRVLRVSVTAANVAGSDEARSAPTSVVVPAPEPTPEPTVEPTPAPTVEPTPAPSVAPTVEPTPTPTVEPAPALIDEPASLLPESPVGGLAPPTADTPADETPPYLDPFPVVRIRGAVLAYGADVTLLKVRAGRAARVVVTCTGPTCPVRRVSRRPGRLRVFERVLERRTVLTVRVTRAGFIGKYARIRIRGGAAPARRDACLLPGRRTPSACPGP
jgi:hypothetical protein